VKHTPYSINQEWNQNIIRNLRTQFPAETKDMSDINILDEYEEYSMSDTNEMTFGEWVS
jgi:hypothetical protein